MPTVKVEEDFMRSLLDDLDTSIAGSIPPVTPRKSKKAKYATPKKRTPLRKVKLEDEEKCLKLQRMSVDIKDVDLDALLDGAADWEDMSDDDVKTETGVGVGTKTRIRTPMSAKKKLLRHSCSPLRIRTPKKKSIVPSGALSYMSVKLEEVDMKALLEGINDEWDDVLEEDVKPAPKPKATYVPPTRSSLGKTRLLPPPKYVREPSTKCVVDAVAVVENNCKMEKHLVVKVDKSGETRLVFLQGEWAQTDVRAGDTINIIGSFDQPSPSGPPVPSITLNFHNLLVLHPDILISATSISNTWQCSRRPLIADLVKNTSEITPALVWGNTLHEVMQTCLAEENWDKQFIENKIDEAVMKSLHLLVQIDVGIEAAKVELRARAKGLEEFSQLYISDKPKPNAYLSDHRSQGRRPLLALTGVHDIEEEIWSPTYGLKGKIDASMQARIAEEGSLQREETCWSVPFEIKTGRTLAGMEHRAQTMLYTLLMSERYGLKVPAGLLYYTQAAEVIRVWAPHKEIRGLIMNRNEMAGYLFRRTKTKDEDKKDGLDEPEPFLPPTIDDDRACGRCYSSDGCMLYRKAVEGIEDDSSPISDFYERKTSHLTPTHTEFFKSWEALISSEEQEGLRFRKELWTLSAAAREKAGRCFADMIVLEHKQETGPRVTTFHRHTYKFTKRNPTWVTQDGTPTTLLNGQITEGDPVSVSIEPDLLALARGFVIKLTPHYVTVGVDHEVKVESTLARMQSASQHTGPTIFRIDKDELAGAMGKIRNNLARLFYADGDSKRLSLVVDLTPPVFDESDVLEGVALPPAFNPNQKEAMRKILSARDYALVLGMPGTGKTTTIAEIIKALVAKGKSVLLTSYTHSAVDTILLKLDDVKFKILRLGNEDRIHPDVLKHTLGYLNPATTIEQLEYQILVPPVVATTCLSVDHALFSRRKFDYCFVDEASQITLPTCLGPLRFADRFVLVGDHFQLPPLVRSKDARKGGMDVSLFRRLCDAHPSAVVDLAYQYRMNEDIMLLSNKLIYGDRLHCGSKEVAERKLVLPNRAAIEPLHHKPCHEGGCWMERIMDENCAAVFVDTDALPAPESRVGEMVQNVTEALLAQQVAEHFIRAGIDESNIGIISLYRQQIKLISHLFENRPRVEVLTADRSQGRDKECIIITMVRSNDSGSVGDLLKDWRRINVSFTRARSKLVIFGSRKTLNTTPLMKQFFTLLEEKGWILRLPSGADKMHPIGSELERLTISQRLKKRSSLDLEDSGIVGPSPKRMKARPESVLHGRNILADVLNDLA